MLDCKQLQVGDFCVATVPRSRNELPARPAMPLMPPLASVTTDLNPTLVRSRSETSTSTSSNARKRRASFVTQSGSVSLPSSSEFAAPSYQSRPTWNPWMSAGMSPEVEKQEQEPSGLEPVQPTDLRTNKSREKEEEEHLSS